MKKSPQENCGFQCMEFTASNHKCSNRESVKKRILDDTNTTFAAPRRPRILQLRKQLEDQFLIRGELEKATVGPPLLHGPIDEDSLTKPAKDLIKEISILEFEVKHLEKYLLSLYRKTFRKTNAESKTNKREPTAVGCVGSQKARDSTEKPTKEFRPVSESRPMEDSGVNRSHSSLSFRTNPNRAVDSYHSLPLGMLEHAKDDFSSVSLADHLGGSISDNIRVSANWISEEMVKCVAEIYCQAADPPLFHHEFPSSPVSFPSPPSGSSPRDQFGMWSPRCEEGPSTFGPWAHNDPFGPLELSGPSSFGSWAHNDPFGPLELSGPGFTTVEVQGICRNPMELSGVGHKERNFRSLVSQLERVDPRKLKHEERLAFWINVHNALAMHSFLVHGTPRGALKRISLAHKATSNIGGHMISVGDIQSTILGCRLPHPGQWLQSLLFAKPKHKSRDARKAYATKHPQPLLYFALCSGSHSDPMVRVYTPKTVFQELEVAKEEHVHNNLEIQNGQKMFLPKLVDLYAKDSSLSPSGLTDVVQHSVPECHKTAFETLRKGKFPKRIEWVPHNFAFRYLLSPDLAK